MSTYTLAACATCTSAIGFSVISPDDTASERKSKGAMVAHWASGGRRVTTTTDRDELNVHMRTFGNCTCEAGRNDG